MSTLIAEGAPASRSRRLLVTILIALTFTAGLLVAAPRPAEAIVGGTAADASNYPFMAAFNENGDQICGASLIAPQWVLTAAHCVGSTSNPSIYSFTFGKSHLSDRGGETIAASQVIVHPLYASTGVHDVALFKLERSSSYEPLRVAHPENDRELWEPGDMARVIGYGAQAFPGFLADDQLRQVDVPVVDDFDCQMFNPFVDPETEVCAGEPYGTKDACQGDSGGPLFVRDSSGAPVQMGVVSWGWGCGYPTQYGVYSRVGDTKLYDWIQQNVGPSAPVESQEPEFETVTVAPRGRIAAQSVNSVTRTEFVRSCSTNLVTQGVDAYVWSLPEELSVDGAVAQVGGYSPVGWPVYWDLDLRFYSAENGVCTLVGDSLTDMKNERAAIPAGTDFVLATAWVGAHIPVELTVDVPITDGGGGSEAVATSVELSADNPSSARFREGVELKARLTDASGDAIAGQAIRFALVDADGSVVQIAPGSPTNADGISTASFAVGVPAGDYTVRASFAGAPNEYLESDDEGDLTVTTAASALSVTASGNGAQKKVTATLTDAADSQPLAARTVEIFGNCELIGTGETASDGSFTMEVPPKYRSAVAQFSAKFAGDTGSERYYSASQTGAVC
ncbi:MAG TPA: trypsin-like serine protease [Actinomycetota bacterium]|nr:trypsin-like serine protease [Actinomycetota bacterium]